MTLADLRVWFGQLWRATLLSQAEINANAAQCYAFWRPKVPARIHGLACLGDIDGEVTFDCRAVGDHGEAHGLCQWHTARADAILKGCGIDVRTAPLADQLRAMEYEMREGAYKRVWPRLIATTTLWSAVGVMVHDFEGSGQQNRDIQRRVRLALNWAKVFTD